MFPLKLAIYEGEAPFQYFHGCLESLAKYSYWHACKIVFAG